MGLDGYACNEMRLNILFKGADVPLKWSRDICGEAQYLQEQEQGEVQRTWRSPGDGDLRENLDFVFDRDYHVWLRLSTILAPIISHHPPLRPLIIADSPPPLSARFIFVHPMGTG